MLPRGEHPAPPGVDDSEERRGEDAALAGRAAAGDSGAFEEIVQRHAGLVLTLGRRMLGNRDAAEDLLQDVFLRVHRSLGTFRADASLKTWIARVTMNAARNRRRDDARRLRVVAPLLDAPLPGAGPDGPTLADTAADSGPSPEQALESSRMRARLETAIAALPDDFREALILRDVEGLAYEEIAAALEISIGTVKSRIARARARVAEAIEGGAS